jgi:hypothetical protein
MYTKLLLPYSHPSPLSPSSSSPNFLPSDFSYLFSLKVFFMCVLNCYTKENYMRIWAIISYFCSKHKSLKIYFESIYILYILGHTGEHIKIIVVLKVLSSFLSHLSFKKKNRAKCLHFQGAIPKIFFYPHIAFITTLIYAISVDLYDSYYCWVD